MQERIAELKNLAKEYKAIIETKVLDNCPFIVEVWPLTVSTDEAGKIITHNAGYPTQFTKKTAEEISKVKFWNGNNEQIIPKIYGRVEWYKKQLEDIENTLKLLTTV